MEGSIQPTKRKRAYHFIHTQIKRKQLKEGVVVTYRRDCRKGERRRETTLVLPDRRQIPPPSTSRVDDAAVLESKQGRFANVLAQFAVECLRLGLSKDTDHPNDHNEEKPQ